MKKKVFLLLFCFASVISMVAQKRSQNIDYAHPYVSNYGFAFHTTESKSGNLGFIYVECDKTNNIWVKYLVHTPFDVDELVDSQGRHIVGQYTISQGKNLYLKLDNEEIMTLKCSLRRKVHNGYYTGNNSIYKQYDFFCYFKLSAEQLQKLKEHEIIKMRCELKFEVMDMRLDNDKSSFCSKLEELQNKKNEKMEQEKNKDEIKNNPLKGF